MIGLSTRLKRILGRISIERITIAVSICYMVGVVLLLQYNSIYVGDVDFDFIRIKPIIVGIEYFLYLALPLLIVCIPIIVTSKKHFSWFWAWFFSRRISFASRFYGWIVRGILCSLLMAILLFIFGVMFHYFLPYTEYMLPSVMRKDISLSSLAMISVYFWKVYMCWDICLLAFIALLIVSLAWTFRHCGYVSIRTAISKRIYYALIMILLPLGFIINMFYFLRDVYPNISQAVAGGAPVSGIITIEAPGEQLRHDSYRNLISRGEITKFCSVLNRDENFWFIDEQLICDTNLGVEYPSFQLRPKTTRIRSCDVKQFTPLRIPMFIREGRRTLFTQDMLKEYVHEIDMFLELRFTTLTPNETVKAVGVFNTTNDISVVCITDKLPLWKLHSPDQYVLKEGSTNFCYYINYRHLPLPKILTVSEFKGVLTNNNIWAMYVFDNLPEIPKWVFPSSLKLGFVVNYHMPMVVYLNSMHEYGKAITVDKGDVSGNTKTDMRSRYNSLRKVRNEDNACGTNMTNQVIAPTDSRSLNPSKLLK